MVTERNWLVVYEPFERWHGRNIPEFFEGQEFIPSSLMVRGSNLSQAPSIRSVELDETKSMDTDESKEYWYPEKRLLQIDHPFSALFLDIASIYGTTISVVVEISPNRPTSGAVVSRAFLVRCSKEDV